MKTSRSSILLLLASACWGLGTVFSKQLLQTAPPITLFATQLATSVVFLWSVVGLRKLLQTLHPVVPDGWQPPLQPLWQPLGYRLKDKLRRATLGILEPGLTYALGTIGLSLTTASNTALMGVAEPLIVIILAAIILREKITFARFCFVLIGCAGAVLVAGNSAFSAEAFSLASFNSQELMGNLLVFAGLCAAALCVVLTQRSITCAEPLTLTAGQQTASLLYVVLPLLVVAALNQEAANWNSLSLSQWALMGLSGIVQYALSFWLYWMGAKHTTASVASLCFLLIPVFGVAGSLFFLGEQLAPLQIAGAALILIAVFSVSQQQNAAEPAPAKARRVISYILPRQPATRPKAASLAEQSRLVTPVNQPVQADFA
jgi:drug/metabolite transporter (DMT)-like permease